MNVLTKISAAALDILFPPICLHCQNSLAAEEKDGGLCHACLNKIPIQTTLFCSICRARLPENKKICHKNSSYRLAAAANFDSPARDLIHQLKYHSWSRLRVPIKKILENYLKNLNLKLGSNWLVIPIPLHSRRERQRGFNQAELIGKIIAEYYELPLEKSVLIRQKETKSQIDFKDWAARQKNLAGAFTVLNPKAVARKNIILVDDVYTSGATINETVTALRSAGAKKIIALVLARAK